MIAQQPNGIQFLFFIAVFVGVLLAFEGLRQLVSREEDMVKVRNRRMRMLASGATTEEVMNLLREDPNDLSLMAKISAAIRQSGLSIGLTGLAAIGMVIGFAAFVGLMQVVAPPLAAIGGLVFAVLVPTVVVRSARKRRLDLLVSQLPEALDLMARGLKVGHPLNVTLGSVAKDMPDPIGSEFGLVQDQVSYGDSIVDALSDMAERLDVEDIRYFSVCISIQHGSGGNLARVLLVLSKVIRDRATMRKKIKAISSEGRFSALILSGLPFGIFGMISTTSPDYYRAVQDDPIFMPIMFGILGLILVQWLILRHMVNFKF